MPRYGAFKYNENRYGTAAAYSPGSTQELRNALSRFADATRPWTYTDRYGKTHKVYLARMQETTVHTSKTRDEPVIALVMVEAEGEAQEAGATGPREQEQFLIGCADKTTPLEYLDRQGNKHRTFITHLELQQRRTSRPRSLSQERIYEIKMIDAWGGLWVQQTAPLVITTRVEVTIRAQRVVKWAASDVEGEWGLFQWS